MIYRCDLKKQYRLHGKMIIKSLKKVLASGRYVLGEEAKTFEREFAAYCNVKFSIAVASGTEALYLSLASLGIEKGDEVITSPFTPIPTVSSIVMAGAKPVFLDIKADDLLIDVDQLEAAITNKTKAVMPVHLFGNVAKMDKILMIARKHNIFIVEDACQAHGSDFKEKKAGTWGDLGCFSFYPTKNLGGYGDSGLVVTNDLKLDKKIRLLRDYGRDTLFTTVSPGVNSRMDEIQAAILRIKLRYLDENNRRRNKLAKIYFTNLKNTPLVLPIPKRDVLHNFHVFVIRCFDKRDALQSYLERNGIQTNIYYPISMHLQRAYKYLGYKRGDFPVSEKMCNEVLALPMYAELEPAVVEEISRKIVRFFNRG